jgi:hypothetical protein
MMTMIGGGDSGAALATTDRPLLVSLSAVDTGRRRLAAAAPARSPVTSEWLRSVSPMILM